MTVRKVSISHPHFPPDTVFGVEGVGQLTNDGTPVEVDSEEYQGLMGRSLEDAFANDAIINVEGMKPVRPAQETQLEEAPASTDINEMLTQDTGGDSNG